MKEFNFVFLQKKYLQRRCNTKVHALLGFPSTWDHRTTCCSSSFREVTSHFWTPKNLEYWKNSSPTTGNKTQIFPFLNKFSERFNNFEIFSAFLKHRNFFGIYLKKIENCRFSSVGHLLREIDSAYQKNLNFCQNTPKFLELKN